MCQYVRQSRSRRSNCRRRKKPRATKLLRCYISTQSLVYRATTRKISRNNLLLSNVFFFFSFFYITMRIRAIILLLILRQNIFRWRSLSRRFLSLFKFYLPRFLCCRTLCRTRKSLPHPRNTTMGERTITFWCLNKKSLNLAADRKIYVFCSYESSEKQHNNVYVLELEEKKKSASEQEYDPYKYRKVEHPTT